MMDRNLLPSAHSIQFGSERIHFRLSASRRKTLAISVHPDLSVSVVVPSGAELQKISDKVKKRAPWIIKKQIYFSQFLPKPERSKHSQDKSLRLLGRQYRLKIDRGDQDQVRLSPGVASILVSGPFSWDRAREVLEAWLQNKTKRYFD